MSHRATLRICSVVPLILVTLLVAEKMVLCSVVPLLLITLLTAMLHREDESLLCCPTIDNPAHCSAYSTNQSRRPAVSLYTVWDMYRNILCTVWDMYRNFFGYVTEKRGLYTVFLLLTIIITKARISGSKLPQLVF